MSGVLADTSFCHLTVGVGDMDRSLDFYRTIGLEVVFDQLMSGEAFDAALHSSRQQQGRVVGGLLGGVLVELMSLGGPPPEGSPPRRGIIGLQNVALSVVDLDDTHARLVAAGLTPDQAPFEIGGVRMFFVRDPDGTPVEFIELPGGARSAYEMHTGVPLQVGPAR